MKLVTILSEKGSSELVFYKYTTKTYTLDDVAIKLYDKDGKLIEKYTKKDLNSQAAGNGLVEDGQIYFIRLRPQVIL